ncbi:lytic transglycosylase domain-containing protein [Sabulicella rubraurantiaca]|uniref:lytic transglycosylase domain-containing protein n=1 Tax=Sabulicella rubraurantiaca TaxID=2811429 RepID=UPI001A9799FF|nr:lytic transglycosylase domain-containing protein [Sabulicella rubraurantiaca]
MLRRSLLLSSLALPAFAQTGREAGRAALLAAQSGRWTEAAALAESADPLLAKLVAWMRLTQRGGASSAAEIVGFIESAPDWPQQNALQTRAEEMLALDADDSLVLRFHAPRPARTLDGAARHAGALINAGRLDAAREAARRAWGDDTGSDALAEPNFLARVGNLLDADAHWRRFNRLFFARDLGGAQRVAPLLDPVRARLAELRLATGTDTSEAPASARDAGATLTLAQSLRRADRDAEAAALWAAAMPAQRDLPPIAQRAIWTERQVLARKLLRLGDPRTAYQVASQHGQTIPGEARQEAEFLAGFIALRFLEDPARAMPHFRMVGEGSRSAITQARSLYWQGRAERNASRARAHWQQAAGFPVTFYGQMAALALGEDPATLSRRITGLAIPRPAEPEARAFLQRELVRLVLLMADLGEGRRARPFLLRLEELSADNADRLLVARLATGIGRPDHAVWVARRGGAQGAMLVEDGWPSPYPAPGGGAEPAVVFAISRQESNFEIDVVSSANARGVMQLLPATAASVARRIGVPHNPTMLNDPSHNMRLGSAYIADRLERYGGAMPLAFAAYNAGAARVDEWLGTYGDPRSGFRPMLDWMELIPFSETRNYVQRVIENVAIYRAKDPATQSQPHPMAAWPA